MSAKNRRGGLGRGLGALIPTAPPGAEGAQGETSRDATDPGGRPMGYPPMPPYDAGEHRDPAAVAGPDEPASMAQPAPSIPSDAPRPESSADELVPVTGAQFVELPIPEIRPNPKQPRQVFDEEALSELTHSIREFGVLQPVVVRQIDTGYELVMGERRLRAAASAGLARVPAIVRTTSDDAMLRDALLENVHRAQLNPLEEAAAYQQLLEEFGATHDELATRIGRSRPQVSNTIRLLNLPVPVQRRVAAGVISAGHARALLAVDDTDVQEDLAGRIVAEGLSVRATEELVALHQSGHGPKKSAKRAAGPRITAPALVELADRLSDAFDTRVKIDLGQRKGKITVEFATIDDLERIVGVMSGRLAMPGSSGPDLAASLAGPDQADRPPAPESSMTDAPDPTEPTEPPEPPAAEPSSDQDGEKGAEQGAEPASAAAVSDDYSGWGGDHVPDPGAWNDSIRYDPNES